MIIVPFLALSISLQCCAVLWGNCKYICPAA